MEISDHEDLLIEILLKLPAESLSRFKLVSKTWLSLISGHDFYNRHTLHHHGRPPSLLLHLPEPSNYFYLQNNKCAPCSLPPSLTKPKTLSFSNGLFLLQCASSKNLPMEDCIIYNPATRQSRKILLEAVNTHGRIMGLNLAFDPLPSPYYKIVCVRVIRKGRASLLWRSWWTRCQIEVYDSESCTWNLCGGPFLASRDAQFDNGIYWKGGIHWRGVFFDLHQCAARRHPEVMVPGDMTNDDISDSYVESKGYLHYVAHFRKERSVMVFELLGDCSEWLLKYRVNIDRVVGPASVLSFIRGNDEEDSTLVLHEPGKITGYKVEERSMEELVDFRDEVFYKEGCVQFAALGTFQFTGILASI